MKGIAVTIAAALLPVVLAAPPARAAECRADGAAAAAVVASANGLRDRAGLAPLAVSPRLDRAARHLACDMARTGSFSHTGSDGSTLMTRLRKAGCRPTIAAENIAWGHPDAASVLAGWMASDGHRRNLLLAKGRQTGVARVEGQGKVWWVMVLAAGC